MSDHEFENYLTLIGRFLRLSAPQREAIGAELRDHFESRLAELIGQGRSHEDAVRLALEEFGDAAGLAAQFSYVTQSRRRRLIMRCTVASVAALAAAVFVAMAMWPDQRAGTPINRAVADASDKKPAAVENPFGPGPAGAVAILSDPKKVAVQAAHDAESLELAKNVEGKLDGYTEVEFVETPLSEVLAYLGDKYRIQMYVKRSKLNDVGVDPAGAPVTVNLRHVRLKMLLDLVLEQVNTDLGYCVRDGVLFITTKADLEGDREVRVYNCAKLLSVSVMPKTAPPTPGIGNGRGVAPGGLPMSAMADSAADATAAANHLIDVIKTTIAKQSWECPGDTTPGGTISEYDGLLVVNNTPKVQDEVQSLLNQLERGQDAKSLK